MTVQTLNAESGPFAAGGTVYTFTFQALAASDVKVYVGGGLASPSIALNADQDASPGGTATFGAATAGEVLIRREVPLDQQTEYTVGTAFPAATHEAALDRLVMQLQDLKLHGDDGILTVAGDVAAEAALRVAADAAESSARAAADALIIASGATPANVGIAPVIATGSTAVRTVASRFADVVNVKDFGAVGDGVTDDTAAIQAAVDAAFGPESSPHGTDAYLNRPLFFPAGQYIISSPISFYGVQGAHIYGAGRMSTSIYNNTGSCAFAINGMGYSKIECLSLHAVASGGAVLDLDWDHVSPVSTQQVTLQDLFINNDNAATSYGISIGKSQYQASEILILNCFIKARGGSGIGIRNYNALSVCVVGGNIGQCNIGIEVGAGSCPVISGVGFQGSADYDIVITNSAGDGYLISGCRTESENFVKKLASPASVAIVGCSHKGTGLFSYGDVTIVSCTSLYGTVSNGARNTRIGSQGLLTSTNTSSVSLDFHGTKLSLSADNNVGNRSTPVSAFTNGIMLRGGTQTAPFTDTFPAAADILAATNIGGVTRFETPAGANFRMRMINNTDQVQTVAAGTGMTLYGPTTLAARSSRDFICVVLTDTTLAIYG